MNIQAKYDKLLTGLLAGLVLPVITALVIFMFSEGDPSLKEWLRKITDPDLVTKMITLCVVPNVLIFLLFNHFDMLRAARGVLGLTIFWAVLVFGIKFII